MSDIFISSIQALTDLRNGLNQYSRDTRATIRQLDTELHRTQKWLEQRKQFWEGEVRRSEEAVRQAQAVLIRCQNSNRGDRKGGRNAPPDCSGQRAALARAESKLQEARNNLLNVNRWLNTLGEAAAFYKQKAQSMNRFIDKDLVKGQLFLEEKTEALNDYISVTTNDTASSKLTTNTVTPSQGMSPIHINNELTSINNFSLPKGFRWVNLSEIDFNDIPENLPFEKASAEEMKAGFKTLKDKILPMLQNNNINSDYFGNIDRVSGQQYRGGQQEVFQAFFGRTHIRLSRWSGEKKYNIDNGRHRIKIALELGWPSVPARTSDVDRS